VSDEDPGRWTGLGGEMVASLSRLQGHHGESRDRLWDRVLLGLRLVIAAVLLAAAAGQLDHRSTVIGTVSAFRLLPAGLDRGVGDLLGFVELGVGLLLVIGLLVRFAASVAAVIELLYLALFASADARGLRVACGCFGVGGPLGAAGSTHYPAELLLSAGLLLGTLLLLPRSARLWSLDASRRRR